MGKVGAAHAAVNLFFKIPNKKYIIHNAFRSKKPDRDLPMAFIKWHTSTS